MQVFATNKLKLEQGETAKCWAGGDPCNLADTELHLRSGKYVVSPIVKVSSLIVILPEVYFNR